MVNDPIAQNGSGCPSGPSRESIDGRLQSQPSRFPASPTTLCICAMALFPQKSRGSNRRPRCPALGLTFCRGGSMAGESITHIDFDDQAPAPPPEGSGRGPYIIDTPDGPKF